MAEVVLVTVLFIVAAALLVLAAAVRVPRSSPPVRVTVAGLSAGAVVAALQVPALYDAIGGLVGPNVAVLLTVLAITAAATAGYAVVLQVAPEVPRPRLRPTHIGLVIGALQIVLFAAADSWLADSAWSYFAASSTEVEIALLWSLTAGWGGGVGAMMLVTFRPLVPDPAASPIRLGLRIAGTGMTLLLLSTVAGVYTMVAQVSATAPIDLTAGAGAILVGAGMLVTRLTVMLTPKRTLRRLQWLADTLAVGSPEWAERWQARTATGEWINDKRRMYLTVQAINELRWDLLKMLDKAERDAASAFAAKLVPSGDQRQLRPLAEACWLRLALHYVQVGGAPNDDPLSVAFDTHRDRPAAIEEDIAYLLAVERAWRHRAIGRFLREAGPPAEESWTTSVWRRRVAQCGTCSGRARTRIRGG